MPPWAPRNRSSCAIVATRSTRRVGDALGVGRGDHRAVADQLHETRAVPRRGFGGRPFEVAHRRPRTPVGSAEIVKRVESARSTNAIVNCDLVARQFGRVAPLAGQPVDRFVELEPHHDVERRTSRREDERRLADAFGVLDRRRAGRPHRLRDRHREQRDRRFGDRGGRGTERARELERGFFTEQRDRVADRAQHLDLAALAERVRRRGRRAR